MLDCEWRLAMRKVAKIGAVHPSDEKSPLSFSRDPRRRPRHQGQNCGGVGTHRGRPGHGRLCPGADQDAVEKKDKRLFGGDEESYLIEEG